MTINLSRIASSATLFLLTLSQATLAQNFELPTIFIDGEQKQSAPVAHDAISKSPEKENAIEAQHLELPKHGGGLTAAAGSKGRYRIEGSYQLSLEELFLNFEADIEKKSDSARHDNYTNRQSVGSLHLQLGDTYSFVSDYRHYRNDLELPGPNDSFDQESRSDTFSNILFGVERSDLGRLSKFHLYSQREKYEENFAKTTHFEQSGALLLHQWEVISLDASIVNDKVDNGADETSGFFRLGANDIKSSWAYELHLGIWDGSRSAAKPIGSLNLEYFVNAKSTLRLTLESQRARPQNETLYYHDNSSLINAELLHVNHKRHVELAWIWTELEALQWSLGLFTNSQSHYLYYDYDQTSGLYTPETIGDVDLAGVNFDLSLDIFKPVTIEMRYTYEHEHRLRDEYIQNLPLHARHKLQTDIAYTAQKWHGKLSQSFVGERYAFKDESSTLGSYQTWDLHLQATVWRWVDIYCSVKNIFDDRYSHRAYYRNEGRIIWGGIEAAF